jgi:hypothetical protein
LADDFCTLAYRHAPAFLEVPVSLAAGRSRKKMERSNGRILASLLTFAAAAGMPMAAGALVLAVPAAQGQVLQVNAWHAVVTADDAVLRCGHGDLMYPVAALSRGQVLRVTGEGQGWASVVYPAGVPAFVPADSLQVEADGRTATITKPTRLKAFNMSTGLRGSWKDVLDETLPAGAKLTLMDSEPMPDGRGGASWRVVPPERARAFVPLSALRRATDEEVQQHNTAMAANPMAANWATAPRQNPQPASPTTAEPVRVTTPTNPASPLAGPAVPNSSQQTPGSSVSAPPQPERKPVVLPPSPFEKLEAAFAAVRNVNPDQAEYSELLAEFEKAIGKLDPHDDSPATQAIRPRLQQRAEFLKLRAELQTQRRKLAELETTISQEDKHLAETLAAVDRSRQYTIVGRLSASTIYDGERLPLMYRVQSVGGPAPRTLAYIRPDEKLGIDARLGQIVGVLGDATFEPTLRVNIITPMRVDALEATATAIAEPDGD